MINCTGSKIRLELYKFFLKNPSINPKQHAKNLEIDCPEEMKEYVVVPFLNQLEKEGIVFCVTNLKEKWWVLAQDLNFVDKNVNISFELQLMIAEILNHYAEITHNPNLQVDVKDFSSFDIQKLVLVVENLIKINSKA